MGIRIKNWRKFQHYKRRNPPWIRLYHDLLRDPEWFELSDGASRLLVNLWLIASEDGINGELPSMKQIAFRLRKKVAEIELLISELDHWLECDASTMLADCVQDARPETESEAESETEKKKYAFRGRIINLTPKDHATWMKTYSRLNLDAELRSMDDWLSSLPDGDQRRVGWFHVVSGALKNRHNKGNGKKPRGSVGPQRRWSDVRYDYEQKFGKVEALKMFSLDLERGTNALVCSNDEAEERVSGQSPLEETGLRDVLPALQAMDNT